MEKQTVRPWDVRPVREQGDPTAEPLYTAVGRALSMWGSFETRLGLLFGQFMLTESPEMAARVFGAIRTFEGRLDLLKAAADLYFRLYTMTETETRFKNLSNGPWRVFGARRNELAHGEVQPYGVFRKIAAPPGTDVMLWSGIHYLVPSFIDTSKWKTAAPPSYCYVADDVEHYAAEFGKLIAPVVDIINEIKGRGLEGGS